jgi:hypothetical protein
MLLEPMLDLVLSACIKVREEEHVTSSHDSPGLQIGRDGWICRMGDGWRRNGRVPAFYCAAFLDK